MPKEEETRWSLAADCAAAVSWGWRGVRRVAARSEVRSRAVSVGVERMPSRRQGGRREKRARPCG